MKEPAVKHTPTEIADDQWGNLWSVCSECGEKITRSYYPEDPGERLAHYSRYWAVQTWLDGRTPNVRVARFDYECLTSN
jgi:hypothetical protein